MDRQDGFTTTYFTQEGFVTDTFLLTILSFNYFPYLPKNDLDQALFQVS